MSSTAVPRSPARVPPPPPPSATPPQPLSLSSSPSVLVIPSPPPTPLRSGRASVDPAALDSPTSRGGRFKWAPADEAVSAAGRVRSPHRRAASPFPDSSVTGAVAAVGAVIGGRSILASKSAAASIHINNGSSSGGGGGGESPRATAGTPTASSLAACSADTRSSVVSFVVLPSGGNNANDDDSHSAGTAASPAPQPQQQQQPGTGSSFGSGSDLSDGGGRPEQIGRKARTTAATGSGTRGGRGGAATGSGGGAAPGLISFHDRIQQGRATTRKPTAIRRRDKDRSLDGGGSRGGRGGRGRNSGGSRASERRGSSGAGGTTNGGGRTPSLLPVDRFAGLAFVAYFHIRVLAVVKRRRAQAHFDAVTGPRCAFVIQCCWRRHRQRRRLTIYVAVRFLQPWILFRLGKRRQQLLTGALVCQRAFRGEQTRSLMRFLYTQMRQNTAIAVARRFVLRSEAQISLRQLRSQRDERNLMLDRCHADKLRLLRDERAAFRVMAHAGVAELGLRPFVTRADYVMEVADATGVAPAMYYTQPPPSVVVVACGGGGEHRGAVAAPGSRAYDVVRGGGGVGGIVGFPGHITSSGGGGSGGSDGRPPTAGRPRGFSITTIPPISGGGGSGSVGPLRPRLYSLGLLFPGELSVSSFGVHSASYVTWGGASGAAPATTANTTAVPQALSPISSWHGPRMGLPQSRHQCFDDRVHTPMDSSSGHSGGGGGNVVGSGGSNDLYSSPHFFSADFRGWQLSLQSGGGGGGGGDGAAGLVAAAAVARSAVATTEEAQDFLKFLFSVESTAYLDYLAAVRRATEAAGIDCRRRGPNNNSSSDRPLGGPHPPLPASPPPPSVANDEGRGDSGGDGWAAAVVAKSGRAAAGADPATVVASSLPPSPLTPRSPAYIGGVVEGLRSNHHHRDSGEGGGGVDAERLAFTGSSGGGGGGGGGGSVPRPPGCGVTAPQCPPHPPSALRIATGQDGEEEEAATTDADDGDAAAAAQAMGEDAQAGQEAAAAFTFPGAETVVEGRSPATGSGNPSVSSPRRASAATDARHRAANLGPMEADTDDESGVTVTATATATANRSSSSSSSSGYSKVSPIASPTFTAALAEAEARDRPPHKQKQAQGKQQAETVAAAVTEAVGMDPILVAYLALLSRTESVERKVLEHRLLSKHTALLRPVGLVTHAIQLRARLSVPPFFAPLLLVFDDFACMRRAAKFFLQEQRGRMAILEAYDAAPLAHLARPGVSVAAERRHRTLVAFVDRAADPFPTAVEEERRQFSRAMRAIVARVASTTVVTPTTTVASTNHYDDNGGGGGGQPGDDPLSRSEQRSVSIASGLGDDSDSVSATATGVVPAGGGGLLRIRNTLVPTIDAIEDRNENNCNNRAASDLPLSPGSFLDSRNAAAATTSGGVAGLSIPSGADAPAPRRCRFTVTMSPAVSPDPFDGRDATGGCNNANADVNDVNASSQSAASASGFGFGACGGGGELSGRGWDSHGDTWSVPSSSQQQQQQQRPTWASVLHRQPLQGPPPPMLRSLDPFISAASRRPGAGALASTLTPFTHGANLSANDILAGGLAMAPDTSTPVTVAMPVGAGAGIGIGARTLGQKLYPAGAMAMNVTGFGGGGGIGDPRGSTCSDSMPPPPPPQQQQQRRWSPSLTSPPEATTRLASRDAGPMQQQQQQEQRRLCDSACTPVGSLIGTPLPPSSAAVATPPLGPGKTRGGRGERGQGGSHDLVSPLALWVLPRGQPGSSQPGPTHSTGGPLSSGPSRATLSSVPTTVREHPRDSNSTAAASIAAAVVAPAPPMRHRNAAKEAHDKEEDGNRGPLVAPRMPPSPDTWSGTASWSSSPDPVLSGVGCEQQQQQQQQGVSMRPPSPPPRDRDEKTVSMVILDSIAPGTLAAAAAGRRH